MTSRTHDLAAFTTLTMMAVYGSPPMMTIATMLAAIGANFLGGLFPDLDEAGAEFYDNVRGGDLWKKIIPPIIGGHRYITHSLAGMAIVGVITYFGLIKLGEIVLIDMNVVWWAFMGGFFSHLVADSLTKEGVMWLFPLPWKFGFPPFKFMRITTGKNMEKVVVFPLLLLYTIYLIATNYTELLKLIIKIPRP